MAPLHIWIGVKQPGRGAGEGAIVIQVPVELKQLVEPIRAVIAATELTLGRTKGPSAVDYGAIERQVEEVTREVERVTHEVLLASLDIDTDAIEVRGKLFRRSHRAPGRYHTMAGSVSIERATYREVGIRNARTVDAISLRTGAINGWLPKTAQADSPFDYASRAEVLIVTDIKRGDLPALAGGYARMIEAAGGGVLGLFTAIRRLRAVHGRIADRLARGGLPLFAQHVDPIDTGTLVDIFRDDPRASLLGTDALRDGVDVPGESLRCVVMEGVPWPKPSILHRARRAAASDQQGGASGYDDRMIRARLAQAFGRLIRTKDDKGHFVVLSSAFPAKAQEINERLLQRSEELVNGLSERARADAGKIIGEYRASGLRPYTLEKSRQFGFDQAYLEACL